MARVIQQTFSSTGNVSTATLTKQQIRTRTEDLGVIPALRTESKEDAFFVAETLAHAGLPVLEISVNAPGAAATLAHLTERIPGMILGAGHVADPDTARECLAAGARFLSMDGLVLEVLEVAGARDILTLCGALTPTEVIAASRAGADFIKIIPCDSVGGEKYIRSLVAAMPHVPLAAAGGINQQNAMEHIAAGAGVLVVDSELLPPSAIHKQQTARIQELARRFLSLVDSGRIEAAGRRAGL